MKGVIWLTFSYDAPILKEATYSYSVSSHALWPIYVPLSLVLIEDAPWRKKTIFTFGVAGLTVGLYLLYFIVATPMVAELLAIT